MVSMLPRPQSPGFLLLAHLKSFGYEMVVNAIDDLSEHNVVTVVDITISPDLFERVHWYRLCYDLRSLNIEQLM
ncbi:hypothetical protein TNCV_4731491 [Trichonephila clavipes]|nr:hypothetical protein TNCV_4731491 [Trichonephila clavipes]